MIIVGNVLQSVLKDGAPENKGEMARLVLFEIQNCKQSFVCEIAVVNLVKTTLVPKGIDKILKSTGPIQGMTYITVRVKRQTKHYTNDGGCDFEIQVC